MQMAVLEAMCRLHFWYIFFYGAGTLPIHLFKKDLSSPPHAKLSLFSVGASAHWFWIKQEVTIGYRQCTHVTM